MKKGGYILPVCLCLFVSPFVCLSVCLSARLLKMLGRDFDEIFGGMGRGPRNNQLDFGGTLFHNKFLKNSSFTTATPIDKFCSSVSMKNMEILGGGLNSRSALSYYYYDHRSKKLLVINVSVLGRCWLGNTMHKNTRSRLVR